MTEDTHQLAVIPQVDTDGSPFIILEWGEQRGAFTPDAARRAGLAILEACADAELQADLWSYLTLDPGSNPEGVARIIQSFRRHRENPVPFTPGGTDAQEI